MILILTQNIYGENANTYQVLIFILKEDVVMCFASYVFFLIIRTVFFMYLISQNPPQDNQTVCISSRSGLKVQLRDMSKKKSPCSLKEQIHRFGLITTVFQSRKQCVKSQLTWLPWKLTRQHTFSQYFRLVLGDNNLMNFPFFSNYH